MSLGHNWEYIHTGPSLWLEKRCKNCKLIYVYSKVSDVEYFYSLGGDRLSYVDRFFTCNEIILMDIL